MKTSILALFLVLCGCVAGALSSCAEMQTNPKATQMTVDAIGIAVCILEHEDEDPLTIAKECEGATVNGVKHLLESQRKAFARRAAKSCPH